MNIISVRNEAELAQILTEHGLTATPLPELPVTIGDSQIIWQEIAVQTAENGALTKIVAELRNIFNAAAEHLLVSCDWSSGRNGCNPTKSQSYVRGRAIVIAGAERPKRNGDGSGNRGGYEGHILALLADGKFHEAEWSGSWSQWQGEGSGYSCIGEEDYAERETDRDGDMIVQPSEVGAIIPDEDLLENYDLEDFASALRNAEQTRIERFAKKQTELGRRLSRAQAIIKALS